MKPSIFLFGLPLNDYAPLARRADELGYESAWVPDHLVAPIEFEPNYPYRESGKPSFVSDTPFPDPFVLIGQLGAVTRKLLLGIGVFVLPLRNPFVTAKAAATAHALSGGRLQLGVGIGWMREEFEAVGEAFARRAARTDEMLAVMRKLWTGQAVEHAGEWYRFRKLQMSPGVMAPPILFGGSSEPALVRAARQGEGWCGPPCTLEQNVAYRERLRRELDAAGRDPSAFRLWVRSNQPTTAELIAQYRDAGFEQLIVGLPLTLDSQAARLAWIEQVSDWYAR